MIREDEFPLIDTKWKAAFVKLVNTVKWYIPEGYEMIEEYGGISFVVPLFLYPKGYHATPNTPLPFISIIPQKRHLALYHMGIYSDSELLAWFTESYKKSVPTKLNMGKSCIRFSNEQNIPYELIGQLAAKISPEQWIAHYEAEVQHK